MAAVTEKQAERDEGHFFIPRSDCPKPILCDFVAGAQDHDILKAPVYFENDGSSSSPSLPPSSSSRPPSFLLFFLRSCLKINHLQRRDHAEPSHRPEPLLSALATLILPAAPHLRWAVLDANVHARYLTCQGSEGDGCGPETPV
ncbi:unnamed protein product [Pleuronectes platessa]|uniref:Uncharacterized protein n=1 Tax=Pleuronectes platessa TaxID=8262 RepID=A0A9N7UFN4_PLEPL|nr:unnamed protein product [Pleuronectes platessa]